MIVVECEQGTQAWAEARRGIPTASGADKIITPAKGDLSKSCRDYACQLIAETILPAHYWIDDDVQTRDMANGSYTEREARHYLEMELGTDIQQVGFVLSDCRRFGASPDGFSGPRRGVELKCPKHKTQIRYLDDGVLPVEYAPQVHWSLCVTKFEAWTFMSYAPGLPPLIIQVEPSEYTVKVAEAMEKFASLLEKMKQRILPGDPVGATREPYHSPF